MFFLCKGNEKGDAADCLRFKNFSPKAEKGYAPTGRMRKTPMLHEVRTSMKNKARHSSLSKFVITFVLTLESYSDHTLLYI